MPTRFVDLYDSHYERLDHELYRAIRAETFGVDLGQESWITAEECDLFAGWLDLAPGQRLLEVACGSGGLSARLAEQRGVEVVGCDLNPRAVEAARRRHGGASGRLEFRAVDADAPLPFPDGSFDAVVCNDAINHLRDRAAVLAGWRRVLRPGGLCLYTDPVVVTGLVSAAELEARSSIGFFLFSAPGANEALLRAAGFRVERQEDLTEAVARLSGRWQEGRARRRAALLELEGASTFEGVQRFLGAVHRLASERRLSRLAFVARA